MSDEQELPPGWEKVGERIYLKVAPDGDYAVAQVVFQRRVHRGNRIGQRAKEEGEHLWRVSEGYLQGTSEIGFEDPVAAMVYWELTNGGVN